MCFLFVFEIAVILMIMSSSIYIEHFFFFFLLNKGKDKVTRFYCLEAARVGCFIALLWIRNTPLGKTQTAPLKKKQLAFFIFFFNLNFTNYEFTGMSDKLISD